MICAALDFVLFLREKVTLVLICILIYEDNNEIYLLFIWVPDHYIVKVCNCQIVPLISMVHFILPYINVYLMDPIRKSQCSFYHHMKGNVSLYNMT